MIPGLYRTFSVAFYGMKMRLFLAKNLTKNREMVESGRAILGEGRLLVVGVYLGVLC